ncbi:putative fatty acyl-CoA reductase CG5065 [Phlebotomus argentipes]|uniref:putative fatty acyl-CoA reductase CG5065 n=1 Tax=Phlebotomus argentipes TaxID=94469 RepID=UPI002893298D|nr:putative fatty acyl-CoA reductase CG5065 [Phlebotomus argentipes]
MTASELPTIAEFFRDREIFITGGTGFLGKAVVEKILYSCSHVKKIYLLLRPKRSVSVADRLIQFKNNQIFNRIREKDESLLDKLEALKGDSMCLKLGLSDEDIKKLENVSVVINSAAMVRFDEPLGQAIFMNTRSARELLGIAENLKHLLVLVHISTTYCNPSYSVIEEKIYPPLANWREAIKLAENMDEDTLEVLGAKYMDFQPNTYTFTKSLAEQIMNEYREKLPIIVFRPSIISPSVKEPFEGWVDNFNGITGILAVGGSGIARVVYSSTEVKSNFQPLDVCVRSLLVATWKGALAPSKVLKVYNCASSSEMEVKGCEIFDQSRAIAAKIPLDEMVWIPNAIITTNYYFYKICLLLMNIFPGMIVDVVLKLLKKKPIALNILRKFHFACSSLSYFMFRDWCFINDNCFNLMNDIKCEDMESFGFDFFEGMDSYEYMFKSSLGGRRFLMKQPDENIPRARRNYRILWLLDRGLKLVFWSSVIYYLVTCCDLSNLRRKFILWQSS